VYYVGIASVESVRERADIYDISYISVYVRLRISVGTVLGYYVSGRRIRLSVRYVNTLDSVGVMTRAFGGSTELSTELSTKLSTERLRIIGSTYRGWSRST